MDLRVLKTQRSIRDAFLELRSKHALERIRATELCRIALINKTTFYKHFRDIYALSDTVEDEALDSIMDGFEYVDSLFSEPELFVRGMYNAFKSHEELVLTLFSGRINVLIQKVEDRLRRHYPALSHDPQRDILISFLIRGATQVLMEPRYDETLLLDTVADTTRRIITSFGGGGELQADGLGHAAVIHTETNAPGTT